VEVVAAMQAQAQQLVQRQELVRAQALALAARAAAMRAKDQSAAGQLDRAILLALLVGSMPLQQALRPARQRAQPLALRAAASAVLAGRPQAASP